MGGGQPVVVRKAPSFGAVAGAFSVFAHNRCSAPQVRVNCAGSRKKGAEFWSHDEVDRYMAGYLCLLLFEKQKPFPEGAKTYHGFRSIFPEFANSLPESSRLYEDWRRLHLAGEGPGIPEEVVYAMAETLRREGKSAVALVLETSMDAVAIHRPLLVV